MISYDYGQTTKQPLSSFEPQKPWKVSNFEGWDLNLAVYKKSEIWKIFISVSFSEVTATKTFASYDLMRVTFTR